LMSASPDAAFMTALSRKNFTILYWTLTSFADQKELRAAPGLGAGIAAWRPGGRDLAVVVSGPGVQMLELWSLDGSRRKLADVPGQSGGLTFRPDGSVVFVGGGRAVEVATGRGVDLTLGQSERVAASLLVAPQLARGMCTVPGMTTRAVIERYFELSTSGDAQAVSDCFAKEWRERNATGVNVNAFADGAALWSHAGPATAVTVTFVNAVNGCDRFSVSAQMPPDSFWMKGQTGGKAFFTVGPEGGTPRIFEIGTGLVNAQLATTTCK